MKDFLGNEIEVGKRVLFIYKDYFLEPLFVTGYVESIKNGMIHIGSKYYPNIRRKPDNVIIVSDIDIKDAFNKAISQAIGFYHEPVVEFEIGEQVIIQKDHTNGFCFSSITDIDKDEHRTWYIISPSHWYNKYRKPAQIIKFKDNTITDERFLQ